MLHKLRANIQRVLADVRAVMTAPRVPRRLQYQTTECGVAVVAMMLGYFGRHVSMEEIRDVTGVSRDCLNAADILAAGRHYGMETHALRKEPYQLSGLKCPFIAHLNFIHFIVIEGFTSDDVLVNDPATGPHRIPWGLFNEGFTGIVITFAPTDDFRRDGSEPSPLLELWQRLDLRARSDASFAIVTSALSASIIVALAMILGRFVDTLVAHRPNGWTMVAGILALPVAFGIVEALRARNMTRLAAHVSLTETEHVLSTLWQRSYTWLNYRQPFELAKSVYDCDLAARIVFGELLPVALTLPGIIVLLAGVVALNQTAGVALILLTAVFGLTLAAVFRWRSDYGRLQTLLADNDYGGMASSIEHIEYYKASNRDQDFVCDGIGAHASRHETGLHAAMHRSLSMTAGRAAQWTILAVIAAVVARLLVSGNAAPGEPVSLLILAFGLMLALDHWPRAHGRLDRARQLLLRMDFLGQDLPMARPIGPAAGGRFEMAGVSFGYSRTRPPLIENISFSLGPGDQLGITGPSGDGKSTIGALAAGLLEPWSGSVGTHGRVLWIDKTPFLFEGTVRENLQLWQNIPDATLWQALRDACLEEPVRLRPSGLDAEVSAQGRNFSGGQRQRLEIARALLRNPAVLILDEAVDGLDPKIEAAVRANLRRKRCALVVISHRRSTLANCDRVLYLVNGTMSSQPTRPSGPIPSNAARHIETDLDSTASGDRDADKACSVAAISSTFASLCARIGVDPPKPIHFPRPQITRAVYELAYAAGTYARQMRLVTRTAWQRSHSPLLAISSDSGEPMVLEPASRGYRALDGKPVSRDSVEKRVFQLHAPLRDRAESLTDWFKACAAEARMDLLRAAGLGICLAAMVLLAPAICYLSVVRLDSLSLLHLKIIVSSIGVLTAAALLDIALAIALLRIQGRVEAVAVVNLYQRLIRVRPGAIRTSSPEDVASALAGISRFFEHLREGGFRAWLNVFPVIAGVAILSIIGAAPAALAMAVTIALIAVPPLVASSGAALHKQEFREHLQARRFLLDAFAGIARLKSLDADRAAAACWRGQARRQQSTRERMLRRTALAGATRDTVFWTGMAGLAMLYGNQLAQGQIQPWLALSGLLIAWPVLQGARKLGDAWAASVRRKDFVPRLRRLMSLPTEPTGLPMAAELAPCAEGVWFRYSDVTPWALIDVCLEIFSGEVVAIVGPSGSGKTTLLRLLLGFDHPDRGLVTIAGRASDTIDLFAWRRGIGVVKQDDRIGSASTFRSQIIGGGPYTVHDAWRAAQLACLDDDIRNMPMGIQTIVEANKLSTGQEQRLLISRQLIREPWLLVLDEATNAISQAQQARIIANVRDLGTTCLLCTHRESAIALADRVILMQDAAIGWTGTADEFFARSDLLNIIRDEQLTDDGEAP